MYEINLLERTIVSSQKNIQTIKLLRLFSLLLTLGVLAVCALVAYTFLETYRTTERINQLKIDIDSKRRINKVKEIEGEWTLNYYKLSAVKDMIKNNTKTGLMLREIGLYMPKDDKIGNFILLSDHNIKEGMKFKDYDVKNIQDYTDKLKDAYSRSMYVDSGTIVIGTNTVTISVKGSPKIEVSPVTGRYVTEKK